MTTSICWNSTTWLNIVFLLVAAFLLGVFTRSGSWPVLRMMSDHPDTHDQANAEHSQP